MRASHVRCTRWRQRPGTRLLAGLLLAFPLAVTAREADLAASYRFLVSPREAGGILFRAAAGDLNGRQLPQSFHDSGAYWAREVCALPDTRCKVAVRYVDWSHALEPEDTEAGDLQTERVMAHSGANVYDSATWQIAVMLGALRGGFTVSEGGLQGVEAARRLVENQNALLAAGHFAAAAHPVPDMIRARSYGETFIYNGEAIRDLRAAYVFRTLPSRWLSPDPLFAADAPAAARELVRYGPLPGTNPEYRAGVISWSDWKPFTGENAWAFLIGPLQAARLYHEEAQGRGFVPFADTAVQNALPVLEAFAALQARNGAVYHAPSGTLENRGKSRVDPYFVAVENVLSLTAGLRLFDTVLTTTAAQDPAAGPAEHVRIDAARARIRVLLHGGRGSDGGKRTGLFDFLRDAAWQDGAFLQGGLAGKPGAASEWIPGRGPRAVDVNTWGIAVLGSDTIDAWHGIGSAWRAWEQLKTWGGYGRGRELLGTGFSDIDGNGRDAAGAYRAGVLSVEWTAGAITAVRDMIDHYERLAARSERPAELTQWIASLRQDEASMRAGIEELRLDRHPVRGFEALRSRGTLPYLYANRRVLVPFGWYANPLPSTCATAWRLMLAFGFDPFDPDG